MPDLDELIKDLEKWLAQPVPMPVCELEDCGCSGEEHA